MVVSLLVKSQFDILMLMFFFVHYHDPQYLYSSLEIIAFETINFLKTFVFVESFDKIISQM